MVWVSLAVMAVVVVLLVAVVAALKRRSRDKVQDIESRIAQKTKQLESARQQLPIDLPTGLGTAAKLQDDWSRLSAITRRKGDPFTFVAARVTNAVDAAEPLSPAVMRELAVTLFELVRTEDYAYRLSADTFGFLLPGCDHAGSGEFVERVKRSVSNLPFGQEPSSVYVSAIVGAAQWDEEMKHLRVLIEAAIKAAAADQRAVNAEREMFKSARKVS